MRRIYELLGVVAVMLVVSSCANEQGDVLDVVPADSKAVAVINAETVLEHFGVRYGADGVSFPSQWEAAFGANVSQKYRRELGQALVAVSQVVDLTQLAVFYSNDGFLYAVANVSDEPLLAVKLEEHMGESKDVDGYMCFERGGSHELIALKDSRVWVTNSPAGVRGIKTQVDKASKSSVVSNEHLSNYFATDEDVLAVVSPRLLNIATKDKESWIRLSATVREMGCSVKASLMNGDGTLEKSSQSLTKVSDDALRHVPNKALCAVAVSLAPDFDWDGVESMAATFLSHGDKGLMEVMMPYLKSIDGTVLFTASAAGLRDMRSFNDPKNWSVKFMAHLPHEKIEEAVNKIVTTIETDYRITLPKDGDFYEIPFPEMRIRIGEVDGYFALIFGEQLPQGENPMARKMTGTYASAMVDCEDAGALTGIFDHFKMILKVEEECAKIDIDVKLMPQIEISPKRQL